MKKNNFIYILHKILKKELLFFLYNFVIYKILLFYDLVFPFIYIYIYSFKYK